MLAISHIAWSPEEEPAALDLMASAGITGIEVAPGRFFTGSVADALGPLERRGLRVRGFQAILFGKSDLLLFDAERRPALEAELLRLAELCASAGATYMVFGAPRNRLIPEGMGQEEAREIARDFFRSVGSRAADLGVVFALEANPVAYGANFCTTVSETTSIVREIDSPGVRWHLDTGELVMNDEDIDGIVRPNLDLVNSVHVSEPHLVAFESPWPGHPKIDAALSEAGYTGPISLEMKRPPSGLVAVSCAVDCLKAVYGQSSGEERRPSAATS